MRDVSENARDVIKILDSAKSLKERVTGLKLVDALMGKKVGKVKMTTLSGPKLPREDCERVLCHMLLEGYLREDFHFTPYSTISYILPGIFKFVTL